jgi:hypothetical protein
VSETGVSMGGTEDDKGVLKGGFSQIEGNKRLEF